MGGVEIDLIRKGIKTDIAFPPIRCGTMPVEIDLIRKGIKTGCQPQLFAFQHVVEIDLIRKGIKTISSPPTI